MRSGGCCSARWNNKERMGPESGPVEPAKGARGSGWVCGWGKRDGDGGPKFNFTL